MSGPFRLFKEPAQWWSFADYTAVLSVMERLSPKTVLEFGPGNSTLALVEGGAKQVDTCEDAAFWFDRYQHRFSVHPPVSVIPYEWCHPLEIRRIDAKRYDMAMIDGPRLTPRRPAVIDYCLQRCAAVLVPLEESPGHQYLRPFVLALADKYSRQLEITETGPYAGAFALLT